MALRAALFALLLVAVRAGCASSGCGRAEGDGDDVGLLQARSKPAAESSRAGLARSARGRAGELPVGGDFDQLQRLTDFSVADLAQGDGSVGAMEWIKTFRNLDKDADGTLSAMDFAIQNASFVAAHSDVSDKDYRRALASLATRYPELTEWFIENEAVIVQLAQSGKKAPDDAPAPPQSAAQQVVKRLQEQKALLLQTRGSKVITECHVKTVNFCWKGLSFVVSFFGISLEGLLGFNPPDNLVYELAEEAFPPLITSITRFAKDADSPHEAASELWGIVMQLWDMGTVTKILEAAISNMSWFDWTVTGVTLIATVTVHVGSGGALLIAQMALTVLAAHGLFQAAGDCVQACS